MIDIHIGVLTRNDRIPWETLNAVGPHVLWFAFGIGLLWWIGRSRLHALLSRVDKLSVAGVEVEFKQTLQQAVDARGNDVPAIDLGRAARRLAQSTAFVAGASLLWIDDEPNQNRFERAIFEGAGATVRQSISSEQARRMLNEASYDVILSDIRRGDAAAAGTDFLNAVIDEGLTKPLIFYVGERSGPVPEGAFGITDSPAELVHLVIDALARRRS